jgi:hypothetical protein
MRAARTRPGQTPSDPGGASGIAMVAARVGMTEA